MKKQEPHRVAFMGFSRSKSGEPYLEMILTPAETPRKERVRIGQIARKRFLKTGGEAIRPGAIRTVIVKKNDRTSREQTQPGKTSIHAHN
jgi:hypothetical protein